MQKVLVVIIVGAAAAENEEWKLKAESIHVASF